MPPQSCLSNTRAIFREKVDWDSTETSWSGPLQCSRKRNRSLYFETVNLDECMFNLNQDGEMGLDRAFKFNSFFSIVVDYIHWNQNFPWEKWIEARFKQPGRLSLTGLLVPIKNIFYQLLTENETDVAITPQPTLPLFFGQGTTNRQPGSRNPQIQNQTFFFDREWRKNINAQTGRGDFFIFSFSFSRVPSQMPPRFSSST